MSRISALKNKISKLQIKIIALDSMLSAEHVKSLDKEIMELKQEGQCKQISIDGLEFDVDMIGKHFKNATEIIIKLNQEIKALEDKKIKNKIKKLFNS